MHRRLIAVPTVWIALASSGLTPSQKTVLATILRVGKQMGASPKALKAAVETGLVESNLTNLPRGDRDSQGVFQQRPSQGWGTPSQVTNVEHAARSFFQRAIPAHGAYGSAGQLAQSVQRSAFPGRYDEQGGKASRLIGGGYGASPVASRVGGSSAQAAARRQSVASWLLSGSNDPLRLARGVQYAESQVPDAAVTARATARPQGSITVAPGANRPGVGLTPGILKVDRAISGVAGRPLTVGTGTNHNRMTSSGNVSDHWSGNGTDIPASGAALLRLGRQALIAAGMPRAQAMKQTGGVFSLPYGQHRRIQILFNTNTGGNHFDHLHVGVSPK